MVDISSTILDANQNFLDSAISTSRDAKLRVCLQACPGIECGVVDANAVRLKIYRGLVFAEKVDDVGVLHVFSNGPTKLQYIARA